jgi:hypothetical protein
MKRLLTYLSARLWELKEKKEKDQRLQQQAPSLWEKEAK